MKDKVAIITGGKRGIGKAIAEELASEGVNLAICSQSKEGKEDLINSLKKINSDISIFYKQVDVRKAIEVKHFIATIMEVFGRIDILINNAGTIKQGLVEDITEEDWDIVLDTNLKGPFLTMKNVIPEMKKRQSGHIINICSFMAKNAHPNFSVHCASKFALRGMSLCVKEELRSYNIYMTIVNPATIATDIWDKLEGDFDQSTMAQPTEVAKSVLFALKNSDSCIVEEIDMRSKIPVWKTN